MPGDRAFISRIIFRLKNDCDLFDTKATGINEFFLKHRIIPWQKIVAMFPGVSLGKLFVSVKPASINKLVKKAKKSDPAYRVPDFFAFFVIDYPPSTNADKILKMIRGFKAVDHAYLEVASALPPAVKSGKGFHRYQTYLNPAPNGVNARYSWKIKGGNGKGLVKFIDIEQGWLLGHENVTVNTLPVTGINHYAFQDHGIATLGIIMMQGKNKGGTGITPKAKGYVISQWRQDGRFNNADAIMAAVEYLSFGDVLLLETQTCESFSKRRHWPIEIQEASFEAIRLATALGIIVIEAAGNGNFSTTRGNDLDLFRSKGKKIFDTKSGDFRDSGAIVVAAASAATPHSKRDYSNYGSRIDVYASGEGVVTAGNYPDSSGVVINCYTSDFSGTSSASAIIAGTVIAIQNIVEKNFNLRLSPYQMRALLSNEENGTKSVNGTLKDKIGTMPDLKKIIRRIMLTHSKTKTKKIFPTGKK